MTFLKRIPINRSALAGIPATLRQPQWIAAIASIGFHGALFAVGPSFSQLQSMALGASAGGEATERRVPMIELTPEEQSRLPDFNSPAYSLLPGEIVPGESSPLMDLLPPAGNRPGRSPLPPLPEGLSGIPRFPIPRGTPLAVSPFPSGLGRNSLVIPSMPGGRPGRPPGGTPTPTPGADAPVPTPPASSEDPRAADLAPRPGETATPNTPNANPNAGETPATSPSGAERTQALIAQMQYSEDLTTAGESEAALTAWANTLTERLGEPAATATQPFAIEVPYDQRLCLDPAPSSGLLGFALLPDGEASAELSTTVLQSTGYPFLNQVALQRLQALAATAEPPLSLGTMYRAVVTVRYDGETCVPPETLLQSRHDMPEPDSSTDLDSPGAAEVDPQPEG